MRLHEVSLLAATLVAGTAGPALADGYGASSDGNAIRVGAELEIRRDQHRGEVERVRAENTGPVPVTTFVIACQGNGPSALGEANLFCDAARLGCEGTPDPDDILYWRWPGVRQPDGTTTNAVNPTGTVCLGPAEAAAPQVIELTAADFRRLPLPPGAATVQPGGDVVVAVPVNVYVVAEPLTLETTLLGTPVTVRATPSAYTWDFADGDPMSTTDPGAAYPDCAPPTPTPAPATTASP